MKKITIIYKIILKTLVLLFSILEFIKGNLDISILFFICFLIFLILSNFKNKFFFLENVSYLLIFIYEFNLLYKNIPLWDTILHALTGFIACVLIYLIFIYLNKKRKLILYKLFIIFSSFCFSLSVGFLFEVFEYMNDNFFSFDMQKDMFIKDIYTTKYDNKEKSILKITDIEKIVIYYDNNKIFTVNEGYLDIGINDTMKDLIVNLIGSVMGSFYIYIMLSDKNLKQYK